MMKRRCIRRQGQVRTAVIPNGIARLCNDAMEADARLHASMPWGCGMTPRRGRTAGSYTFTGSRACMPDKPCNRRPGTGYCL